MRIITQRERFAWRLEADAPRTLYRGLHLNLDAPEGSYGAPTPELKRVIRQYGVDSPEFQQELLKHPVGTFWSPDPGVAQGFAERAGNNAVGVVIATDWDGNGRDNPHPHMDDLPAHWGEVAPIPDPLEIRLKPGRPLSVRSIKVRPSGGEPWRELFKTAPAMIYAMLRPRRYR